jgi:hypothetical protein
MSLQVSANPGHPQREEKKLYTPYETEAFTSTLTLILAPCSRALLEKLIGTQVGKKFPAFYGTRMLITAFTSARHLSLSCARSIQSMPSHLVSWRSTLRLSSHLRLGLPSGLFLSGFPHQNPTYTSSLPCACYMPRPAHSRFDHPNNIEWGVQIIIYLNQIFTGGGGGNSQ